MNTLAIHPNDVDNALCPYGDILADVCRASVSSMKLGLTGSLKSCTSEDYDGCPIFLAKLLRKVQRGSHHDYRCKRSFI